MNERHLVDGNVIERILAHVPRDRIRGVYNRAQHMDRRRELLQEWVDLLLVKVMPAAELMLGPRRPTRKVA